MLVSLAPLGTGTMLSASMLTRERLVPSFSHSRQFRRPETAAFGKWIGENLAKGDKVVASGRLSWREWEPEGGGKRERVSIDADSVVPAPKGGKDTSTAPAPSAPGDNDIPF